MSLDTESCVGYESDDSEPLFDQRSDSPHVTLKLRKICLWMGIVIAVLLVLGTAANIVSNQVAKSPDDKLARLMNRFDLAFEPSLPNWYSSCALLFSALLIALNAAQAWVSGDRWTRHWVGLSLLFVALSIDEGVRFHEMLHIVMIQFVEPAGLLFFPWVIPALLFVAVVGMIYLPFVWSLPPRTRNLILVAGFVFVAGAVGMDMIGGLIVEQYGMESIGHSFAQLFEEMGEMAGVAIFIYALLDRLRARVGTLRLQLS
jgi:hypothetical protein